MGKVLPAPFEPKLHNEWGIAGICLIRLEGIRPKSLPLPCGISSENASRYDGLLLQTNAWEASPFHVDRVFSSYFEDESVFPPGSINFDHALLMEDIPHEWHTAEDLCCKEAV